MLFVEDVVSPFGPLTVAVDRDGALVNLVLPNGRGRWAAGLARRGDETAPNQGRCEPVVAQLDEYFGRKRTAFDVPLRPSGTHFQHRVWAALSTIPYGSTLSYKELAYKIGSPMAVRAVGRANATNPIPIVVPCHRVLGSDGSMTGFGGGVDLKEALLDFEKAATRPGRGTQHQLSLLGP